MSTSNSFKNTKQTDASKEKAVEILRHHLMFNFVAWSPIRIPLFSSSLESIKTKMEDQYWLPLIEWGETRSLTTVKELFFKSNIEELFDFVNTNYPELIEGRSD